MKTTSLLLAFLAFTFFSCQKEEEKTAYRVDERKMDTGFVALYSEAVVHPSFSEAMKHPEVIAATEENDTDLEAYNQVKNVHPKIKPIMEKMEKLEAASPERIQLAVEMKKIAREDQNLRKLLKKTDESLVELIAAYGVAFKETKDGQKIGEKFTKLAAGE